MKRSALISVYKKLIDGGKITGKGVERYNELVSEYRKKLLSSSDSRRVVRATNESRSINQANITRNKDVNRNLNKTTTRRRVRR